MHMGRRCPAQQRHMRVYLLLQEPAKFQPSLTHMPTGSDPQSGRLSAPQLSPASRRCTPLPPVAHSPCSSSTCPGQDPLTFGRDGLELVLPRGGHSASNAAASTDSYRCVA